MKAFRSGDRILLPIYGEGQIGRTYRRIVDGPEFGPFFFGKGAYGMDGETFDGLCWVLMSGVQIDSGSIANMSVRMLGANATRDDIEVFDLAVDSFLSENLAGVYFIQQGTDGPIKIGHTKNVDRRLRSLSTGSPVALHVLALTPGGEREERALHRRFDSLRMQGEWFAPAPELIAFIAAQTEAQS